MIYIKSNKKFRDLKNNKAGYTKMIGGLVALLLMIIVGILVYWETSSAITLNTATANESRDNVNSMATTVFNLLPIVALVIVASIILAVIMGFGGGSKGGF